MYRSATDTVELREPGQSSSTLSVDASGHVTIPVLASKVPFATRTHTQGNPIDFDLAGWTNISDFGGWTVTSEWFESSGGGFIIFQGRITDESAPAWSINSSGRNAGFTFSVPAGIAVGDVSYFSGGCSVWKMADGTTFPGAFYQNSEVSGVFRCFTKARATGEIDHIDVFGVWKTSAP